MKLSTFVNTSSFRAKPTTLNTSREQIRRASNARNAKLKREIIGRAARRNERFAVRNGKTVVRTAYEPMPIRNGSAAEFEKLTRSAKKFSHKWDEREGAKKRKLRQRKTMAAKLHPDRVAKRKAEAKRLKDKANAKRVLHSCYLA